MRLKIAAGLLALGLSAPLLQTAHAATPVPTKMGAKMSSKMSAKKMPMRDAKGHFMKSTTRKMPMRDAKGHFMKKPATGKM